MTPAPDDILGRELTRLALTTAQRAKSDIDATLMAAAYIDHMRKYPADVALAVIRKVRQWWPTLFELQTEADKLVAERRMLLNLVVEKAPNRAETAIRTGGRKLPFDWKERVGMKAAEPAKAASEEWVPDMTPVTVSNALGATLVKQS